MPFCPECKTEYQAGVTQCADCQVDLVDILPRSASEPESPPEPEWVRISSDHDESEAYVLKGFLESEGFDCELENKTFHSQPTLSTTLVNILVRRDQADAARHLLFEKEYLYKCTQCGTFCSHSEKACPECGAAIEEEDDAEAMQGGTADGA